MMELKCCHFDWCVERRGIESDSQDEGFEEIINGHAFGLRSEPGLA